MAVVGNAKKDWFLASKTSSKQRALSCDLRTIWYVTLDIVRHSVEG